MAVGTNREKGCQEGNTKKDFIWEWIDINKDTYIAASQNSFRQEYVWDPAQGCGR
jgi:hypothetical protein